MSSGKHFHNVLCLSEAKGMDIIMESLCAEPEKSGIISVYVCGVRLHICYKRRRSIFEKEQI